jgi:hypothetical protein
MLQNWSYYFTPADLARVEHLPAPLRAAELNAIRSRIDRANRIRTFRKLPRLRPAYTPPGPLWDERLRNPQDFLFGAEAQEVVEPAYTHKAKRRRKKRFADPRYDVAPEQESFFGTPVEWPPAPLPIGYKREQDYHTWLRYYRSLKDVRLLKQWDWFLAKGDWGLRDPILAAAKAGLYQAMVERGMIGGEPQQIDQLTFHTLRRTNPSDAERRRAMRDDGMSRAEILHRLVRSGEHEAMAQSLAGRRELVTLSYLAAAAEAEKSMREPDGEYGPNAAVVNPDRVPENTAAGELKGNPRALTVIYYEYGVWPYSVYDYDAMFALDARAQELRGGLVDAYIENQNSGAGVVWDISGE